MPIIPSSVDHGNFTTQPRRGSGIDATSVLCRQRTVGYGESSPNKWTSLIRDFLLCNGREDETALQRWSAGRLGARSPGGGSARRDPLPLQQALPRPHVGVLRVALPVFGCRPEHRRGPLPSEAGVTPAAIGVGEHVPLDPALADAPSVHAAQIKSFDPSHMLQATLDGLSEILTTPPTTSSVRPSHEAWNRTWQTTKPLRKRVSPP